MNYNQRRPVTMIDDLPDIDYLEGNQSDGNSSGYFDDYYKDNSNTQVNKYIRGDHIPPNESGMYAQHHQPQQYNQQPQQPNQQQHPSRHSDFDEIIQEPSFQNAPNQNPSKPNINCLDLADHIENCPLCSQIYKTDRTPYIIIIVILAIICVLLIKKVLNL